MYPILARLVVSTVAATVVSVGPTTPDSTYSFAAQQVAGPLGISVAEAQARIDRQDDVMALATDAARRFGDSFGGVWVDQAHDGSIVVQAIGGVAPQVLSQLASDHHLTGHVSGRAVTFSAAYLSDLTKVIGTAGAEASRGAPVQFTVMARTDLDKVELTEPARPTREQAAFLGQVRARYGPALTEKVDNTVNETEACSGIYCDTPLRGGVGIHFKIDKDHSGTCTAGFNVKSINGTKAVLTAGHCLKASGNTAWYTFSVNGTKRNIDLTPNSHPYWFGGGPVGLGDYGVIRTANVATENPKGWIYTGANNQLQITSVATYQAGSWPGLIVCKRGLSGDHCGSIQSDSAFVTYKSGVSVWPMVATSTITCHGDSGGPVYLTNKGFGLTSGGQHNSGLCGGVSYFQPLQLALIGFNLSIV